MANMRDFWELNVHRMVTDAALHIIELSKGLPAEEWYSFPGSVLAGLARGLVAASVLDYTLPIGCIRPQGAAFPAHFKG